MKTTRRVLLLLGMIGLISAIALGQAETGLVTGTVTDQSGAAVPGANITMKSVSSGQTRTVTTNADGNYTISNLRPDTYDVTVGSGNFAPQTRRIVVTVGSRNEVSLALAVQGSSTTVEVTAEAGAAQVETQSSELSQVVGTQQISSLPSLTRNPYDFVQTSGNVSSSPMAFGAARGAGVNINGQRAEGTDILLDGGENVNTFTASVGQNVPLDSVQEFRVISNDFSAEYGRASGGIVNVATKSGTNTFHGSAYEYNRISALTSNTYDNNANGVDKSRYTRNQFGYSVGGPIIKNKMFFFNNTEWTRVRSIANLLNWVPDPALLAASAAPTQAFFQKWGALKSGVKPVRTLTAADLLASGDLAALPAGVTPGTPMIDLLSYQAPSDAGGGNPQNTYSTVARVDLTLTDKTTLYGRYARNGVNFFPGTINFSPYQGFDTGETDINQNAMINLTHVWGSNLVSQHKLIGNRLNQQQPLGDQPPGPTLFLAGGPPNIQGQTLILPGYSALSPGLALPFGGPQNVIETLHDVSFTTGRHQWRIGGQYIYTRDNRAFGAFEEGIGFVDRTGDTSRGFANLVAGQMDRRYQVAIDPQGKFPCQLDVATATPIVTPDCTVTGTIGPPSFSRSNRYHDWAGYAQDTWKVTNRLTLNLGLRYEYYGVQHNVDPNLDSNFYFGQGSNIFEQVRNGFVRTATNSPVGGLWAPDRNNFAPRLGFAWDVFGDGKMALRGGYGITYERNFGNVTFNVIQNPPNYAVVFTPSAGQIPLNNYDPFNNGGATTGLPILPSSLRAVDPHIRNAYTHMWNASVQRELLRNTVMAVEYSGSRGLKLYSIAALNEPGYGCVYMGDCIAGGTDFAASRLNNQFTGINLRGNGGDSWYNAVNTRFQTTNLMNTGVTLTANYTWAHAIDTLSSTFSEFNQNNNLGFLDPFNPRLDKGDADFDVRHRIVVSGSWDIPAFKNQNGAFGRVLGGWQVSPILTAQTGYPYTVYDCTAPTDNLCARYIPTGTPTLMGNTSPPPSSDGSGGFIPNTFDYVTLPAPLQLTNPAAGENAMPVCGGPDGTGPGYFGCVWPSNMTRRNAFRQPGVWNLNLAASKNIKLTERFALQFRGEMYNALNHSNLYVQTGGPFNNGGAADASSACGSLGCTAFVIPAKRGSTPTTLGSLGERRFVQFALRLNF
jgi:hypothetical protein